MCGDLLNRRVSVAKSARDSPNRATSFRFCVSPNKNYSFAIELVRRQWSGNAKTLIKGIGVVTGVYVNPDTDQFWLLDYRLYDPDGDGKTKLDHVQDRLTNVV